MKFSEAANAAMAEMEVMMEARAAPKRRAQQALRDVLAGLDDHSLSVPHASDNEAKVAHKDLENPVKLLALDDGTVQLSLAGFQSQVAHDAVDTMKMLARMLALAIDARRRKGVQNDYRPIGD